MKKAFRRPRFLSLLCASSLLILSFQLEAQRAYYEFGVSSEIWDNLELSVEPEVRYDGDQNHTDSLVDLGLSYELLKHFEIGLSYRKGREWEDDDTEYDYDRWAYDLEFEDDLGPIEYSVRLRYTTGFDPEDEITRNFFRYRIKIEPDKSLLGVKPYVGYELYQNSDTGLHERNALMGGLKYKINKSMNLSLEYKQVDKLHSKKDYDVISLSFGYRF